MKLNKSILTFWIIFLVIVSNFIPDDKALTERFILNIISIVMIVIASSTSNKEK
jgi:hypothetical protein